MGSKYDGAFRSKDAALKWAKQMGELTGFLVVDFETADNFIKGVGYPEPIQIAILNKRGDVVLQSLINPVGEISLGSTAIHGRTKDQLIGCPMFIEIYPVIKCVLENYPFIVSYNAQFEEGVIDDTCRKLGLTPPDISWQCAMMAYSAYWGEPPKWGDGYKWQKLTDAAMRFNLALDGAHDAAADCRLTLGVMKAMALEAPAPATTQAPLI
jgi:DNA polymerase III epsilon subunit-like protein